MKYVLNGLAIVALMQLCVGCSSFNAERRNSRAQVYEEAAVISEEAGNPALAEQQRETAYKTRNDVPDSDFIDGLLFVLFGSSSDN
ncbi:hypothetical protein [Microbulbifer hainanensis]|uniref:hypothetical protein n=1 Tax=Microbulbifer hainanensis TaxID=2735675 RepID=UPI0018670EFB|nr:hypothetical protein [Microbulbifer hainanensis]